MLDDDATVDSYELVDWNDRTGIYNIEHTPETKLISTVVTDVNGFLVNTESRGYGWIVQLLLPDREALMTILIQGENPAVHGGRESDTVLSNRRRLLSRNPNA